jgi:hypothetical protein
MPGHGFNAAEKHSADDAEWLEPPAGVAPPVTLSGAGLWLVLRGKAGGSVEVLLSSRMIVLSTTTCVNNEGNKECLN